MTVIVKDMVRVRLFDSETNKKNPMILMIKLLNETLRFICSLKRPLTIQLMPSFPQALSSINDFVPRN